MVRGGGLIGGGRSMLLRQRNGFVRHVSRGMKGCCAMRSENSTIKKPYVGGFTSSGGIGGPDVGFEGRRNPFPLDLSTANPISIPARDPYCRVVDQSPQE
jgi:hypothetical protein